MSKQCTTHHHACDCREAKFKELERENAALRAWKESALAVEREWDAQVTAKILGARLGESCRRAIAREVPKLVVENAALRADKERLDWLEKHGATPICSRAAIDAARNKSPSWGDDQIMGQHLNNGGTPT